MVQYVKTCYGALVQQTSSSLDMESGFQMLPCASSLLAATASSQQGTGGRLLVTAAAGAGPYCKVWTHPDDIEVLFPDGQSPGPLGSTRGERKHKKCHQAFNHALELAGRLLWMDTLHGCQASNW